MLPVGSPVSPGYALLKYSIGSALGYATVGTRTATPVSTGYGSVVPTGYA